MSNDTVGHMKQLGMILVVLGLVACVAGGLLMWIGHIPFLGRLPGDVRIEGKNWGVYAPIATCIVLSVLLTIIVNLVLRFFR